MIKEDLDTEESVLSLSKSLLMLPLAKSSQFNFKILVLDIDYDKIDVEFFKTIAFTDWNLVIDLNPQNKMITEFHNQLNFKKNFVKIHFSKEQNDLNEQIREHEEVNVSNGAYKCYLSADLKYDSNEVDFLQIQELLESLEPFLKRIIVGKHSVMCTDLIFKRINLNYFEKIDEMNLLIKRIIHEKNSKENLELI